jgi:ribose transport system permease protein
MKKIFKDNYRELSVVVAIIAIFGIFSVLSPSFFTAKNLNDILNQSVIYGLMALGIMLPIITGGIDLSIGSMLALTGCTGALLACANVPTVIVIIICLLEGMMLGAVNGVAVAKMKLQPFIATLGTMQIYRGVAYIITQGYPVLGVPDSYTGAVNASIGSVRLPLLLFLLAGVIVFFILRKLPFGTYIYAIGGNSEASRLSGIRVERVTIMTYAVAAMFTALAGLIQISRLGTGDPTTGTGYEMNAIAAAAIGGTSMMGGRGSAHGAMLGAILFAGLKVGLIVLNVNTYYQYVFTGAVVIIAASIEVIQNKISSNQRKSDSKVEKAEA